MAGHRRFQIHCDSANGPCIAGHDVVMLGGRGPGARRVCCTLSGLLDEWTPVIASSELGEHPYEPITPASIRRAADLLDDPAHRMAPPRRAITAKLATPTPRWPTSSATSIR